MTAAPATPTQPELRHRCPGRLRLRWAGLRQPDLRVDWLEGWLARRAGLERARINAGAASLVAEFAERPGVFEDICRALAELPAKAHFPAPASVAPPPRTPLDAVLAVGLAAGGALLPPAPRLGLGAAATAPLILRGLKTLALRGPRGKTLEMAAALYALGLGDGSSALRVAAMSVLGDALRQATEERPGERMAELLGKSLDSELAAEVERGLLARPAPERLSDRLADRLALWSLIFGGLAHAATGQARRALPVFAVDYSCAVKLSAPLAAWRGLREARRAGAKARGASVLEELAKADAFVFTGSALERSPELAEAISGLRERGVRRIAVLGGEARIVAETLTGTHAPDEARSGLSPRAMADAVHGLRAAGLRVAVVGWADADALAMLAGHAGIVLGGGESSGLAGAAAGMRVGNVDGQGGARALLAARDAGAGACAALKGSFAAGVAAHSALFAAREARLLSRRASVQAGRAATASVLLGAWLGASPRNWSTEAAGELNP